MIVVAHFEKENEGTRLKVDEFFNFLMPYIIGQMKICLALNCSFFCKLQSLYGYLVADWSILFK